MKRRLLCCVFCVLCVSSVPARAQTLKNEYLRHIKHAADAAWNRYPQVIADWKKSIKPSELWGYDAPGEPIYLADVLGFLYQETHDQTYADKARRILADFGDLRESYPREYQSKRIEYRDGLPSISNFFVMPPYARAYLRIRDSGVVDSKSREKIEKDLAFSLDHIFHFPEWGAHNRAMLRAESLYYGSVALPQHPHAGKWRKMAETLASDSLGKWEIEDASGYQGIWLYALFSYAEISGRPEIYKSIAVKYYLDYFVQLLTPHGNIADFGDSHWNGNWERFVAVFEKGASVYHDQHYKYVAQELTRRALERMRSERGGESSVNVGSGVSSAFTDAFHWAEDNIRAEAPKSLSQEVLDDVIGKKIVFRNGWDPTSTFLLVNYRDEGDGGILGRSYLRQTISVEEEKMHHGHADENSIALLMSGGSVLLHDGGYRPDLPSGPWGAWRADYFHNRVVARRNKREKNQAVFEFIRNSGAYRQVRTQKIDFLKFNEVEFSRTRLIDDDLGYQWDRIIAWVKPKNLFVVIDGIKALKGDYFTFTNLWHTRRVLSQDQQSFDTAVDKIGSDILPADKSLLIHFPESSGKQLGTYDETRHFANETAIYQTVSSLYKSGDMELFVTVLQPHDARTSAKPPVRLLDVNKGQAVALEIADGRQHSVLGVKLDLEMGVARENIRPRYQYDLGKVKYGEFETDASFLFATVRENEVYYAAATMTQVRLRNQTLMEALPNTFGLQLDGSPPRTGYSSWRSWEDTVKMN